MVSPRSYNGRVGLALLCPITSRQKGYPFEGPLPAGLEATGVILADQMKSLDWRARRATCAGTVPGEVLDETVARLLAIVDPD